LKTAAVTTGTAAGAMGFPGVMRVKLVSSPGELSQAVAEFRTLFGGYSFLKGNRYAE
jgi:hypothetical protein